MNEIRKEAMELMNKNLQTNVALKWNYKNVVFAGKFLGNPTDHITEEMFQPIKNRNDMNDIELQQATRTLKKIAELANSYGYSATAGFDETGRPYYKYSYDKQQIVAYYDFEEGKGAIFTITNLEEIVAAMSDYEVELMVESAKMAAAITKEFMAAHANADGNEEMEDMTLQQFTEKLSETMHELFDKIEAAEH